MNNSKASVLREITPLSGTDCFYIVDRYKSEFTYPLHNHIEFELNYVENAAGARRIVGDSVEIIGNFELVLIAGKDLEHTWEQHECRSTQIREITLQFSSDLFPGMADRNQFASIRKMLELAKNGLSFPISAIQNIYAELSTLAAKKQEFYTAMSFLTILHELSMCPDPKVLSSSSFAKAGITAESRRVEKVQNYINEHFHEEVRLADLADLAGMSDTAFSRFFKLRTGKSLSDYIIDVRLGRTTRLLVDSTHSISEICYSCGFNNLSNFNRIFLKKKKSTPKAFRENYRRTKSVV